MFCSKTDLIQWLKENNPKCLAKHYRDAEIVDYLISTIPRRELIIPEGWILSETGRLSSPLSTICISIVG